MFAFAVLTTFLGSVATLGMMAPKRKGKAAGGSSPAKAKAEAKAKAQSSATKSGSEDPKGRKKRQANMVGQLKNAALKMKKLQQGEITMTEAELAALEFQKKIGQSTVAWAISMRRRQPCWKLFLSNGLPGQRRSPRRTLQLLPVQFLGIFCRFSFGFCL